MQALRKEFHARGHLPSIQQYDALNDLVSTMEAMEQGVANNTVYLSSLDPGVGKTTAVTIFVKQLIMSRHHDHVAFLLCLPRRDEVRRLVKDLDLDRSEITVLTSDPEVNALGGAEANTSRILITTHQMVAQRCGNQTFAETTCFHYRGRPREVRVWDEAMLWGEVVTLNSDQLNALPVLFRSACPAFGDFVVELAHDLLASEKGTTFEMPDVEKATGMDLQSMLKFVERGQYERQKPVLEALYQMSSNRVRLSKENGRLVMALDTRDALPKDLKPILVLDASGRVRHTYHTWESGPRGLTRLKAAPKDYSTLNVRVMEQGGGKWAWTMKGTQYLNAIADLINSKPDEEWLVLYHRNTFNGRFTEELKSRAEVNTERVKTINWGAHQGRNDFAHIQNIVLAGTLF